MTEQTAPPVLSTPDTHIFEDPTPPVATQNAPRLSDEELYEVYEVQRTAQEVWESGYKRAALQFPDHMLRDATRVFEGLERELLQLGPAPLSAKSKRGEAEGLEASFNTLDIGTSSADPGKQSAVIQEDGAQNGREAEKQERTRLYILADTSYGSCCVDEIAAEHVDADVVVHYGRSCLSPTARLPVIYVFTSHALDLEGVVEAFEETFSGAVGKEERVVLMADITYHNHVKEVESKLRDRGWTNLVAPEVIHDPSSIIPNRKVSEEAEKELKEYKLFHISDPPPALLLTLSSRVKEMFIYPTSSSSNTPPTSTTTKTKPQVLIQANTALALRRRYALLTRLSTCAIFGILINTLSVRNYLQTVTSIKSLIETAGKKSYTFVVGKVNAAKIANFSEIGGWVVIGCWESSLIESQEFYRPIITPFELGLCLQGDESRVWTGEWRGDFGSIEFEAAGTAAPATNDEANEVVKENSTGDTDEDSEEESAPPEFDLRSGRYISHSRPMRATTTTTSSPPASSNPSASEASKVLTRRAKGDLATVNGAVSPGAEYLRSQRTWTGLGSDFHEDASQNIEEGRSGVARGYTVGESGERR